MKIRTGNKIFIFSVIRKHNLKYYIQYTILFFIDSFYKVLFSFFSKKPKKKKYTISICSIFKNESAYLKEWLEYNLLIGIDHFYLYNNNSEDDYQSVLKPYIEQGIVTLTDWPEIPGQISSYKHWYEHFRHESNWCAFLDIDEFICPLKDINIKEWLANHNKYPAMAIYWKMFGTSGLIKPNPNKLIIEQFTNSWDKLSSDTKIIYNTSYDIKKFYTSMMHICYTKYGIFTVPPINPFGHFINKWQIHRANNKKIDIQCNHYWSKSYNEYLAKHKRGDAIWDKGISKRNQEMFLHYEHFNCSKDYNIQKYLIELKLRIKTNN